MAKHQIQSTFPLFLLARDIRAVDNAGMELCEIARNGADIMVEARKGSDFFNVIAFPILKNAGGYLVDLNGDDLGPQAIKFDQPYDYVACNNIALLNETLKIMKEFHNDRVFTHENISLSI